VAPPIPGLRQQAPVHRRTGGDIALGVIAVLALAALTVGIPLGLAMFVGLPAPHSLSLSTFTSQVDLTTILKLLSVIVWLAWIQLVWCVFAEIRAAVRNVGVPGRVPLAGATQSVAHRLVTAALLLFSATAALSPALAHSAAPPRPAHSISVAVQARTTGGQAAHADKDTPVSAPRHQASPDVEKIYVVRPPEGRYHESLWEIAQNHLGDGRRYSEIFQLNVDRIQPDGTKLTIASLIRPGWVLRMPSDAYGPGIETITEHANREPGAEKIAEHAHERPAGTLTDSAVHRQADSPARSNADRAAAPLRSEERRAEPATGGTVAHQASAVWPEELAAASLLAAGVLSALGRRRRELLWQRAFGRRMPVPEGDAAVAEQALRFGADDPAVALLDNGLRHLSRVNAANRKPPPTVFAAMLSPGQLHLWVAPPDTDPPAPWTADASGQVWRLDAAAAPVLDPGDALAPYPGLVTLGTNETGRIMVDLEAAHGLIAVRGPAERVRAALAALAVELVTNRWSDRMRVTLVGFGEGLQNISPERVELTASLDDALLELEHRAASLAADMAMSGLDSVLTGRALGGDPGAWAPHYLITGVPPTPEQAQRLLALARTRQRTALGLVVADDVPGASWTWDVTADGRVRAPALGFDLAAQLLPPSQYAAVVSLFADPGDYPPVTDPAAGAAPVPHMLPGARFSVEIGLLGPLTVSAPGPVEPSRVALATEIIAYLAVHSEGVHLNVLTGAIWPRGVTPEVRDATLVRVTAWLGSDGSGAPNLVTDSSGRLRLGPGVRVDWQVFRAFVARADTSGDEAGCLDRALGLVRGEPLAGRDPSRYWWLATDPFCYEVPATVADAAHRLAGLRLAAGDLAAAMAAARAGLRLAPDDETLWQDLLRAAAATGQEHVLRSVVDEVCARVARDHVLPRMAPETEALIDELLPSWRSSAA
jgi:DNA-binding SARP family transcriptional activator